MMSDQDKYQAYLQKLEAAKADVKSNLQESELQQRLNSTLQDLRNQDDANEFNLLLYGLALLTGTVSLLSYFKNESFVLLLPIILILGYLFYYRIVMKRVTKKAVSIKKDGAETAMNNNDILEARANYVLNGIEIKLNRLRLVRLFYMLVFPIFLVLLMQLLLGDHLFGNILLSFLLSYAVAGFFWYYFFRSDVEQLSWMEDQVLDDLEHIKA